MSGSEDKKKSSRFYVRSDGNGGITVNKLTAYISLALMLLIPLISVAVTSASIKDDVSELKEDVPRNTERIIELNANQIRSDTSLYDMQDDIKEIKQDVKSLLRGS